MMLREFRHACRMLTRTPWLCVVVVLTLSLGIGANTAIFTLLNAIMLKPLPVRQPQSLMEIARPSGGGLSYPTYQRLSDRNHLFSDLLAISRTPVRLTEEADSDGVEGQFVSGNYFVALGVNAAIGRAIIPDDDDAAQGGAASVAVICHGLWQRRFGGDATVIGRRVSIENQPFTVIGVAPPEFSGLQPGQSPQFWIPINTEPLIRSRSWLDREDFNWLSVVGRLKPNATAEEASAELDVIFRQSLADRAAPPSTPQEKEAFVSQRLVVDSAGNGLSPLRKRFSSPLFVLMSLVVLVLLVCCANVSNLMLVRAMKRSKEVAIRLALGSDRWRIIRQFLMESLLMSVLGGVAGLILAWWGTAYISKLLFAGSSALDVSMDARVLAFTAGVCLLAGLIFGTLPALRTTRVEIAESLKGATRGGTGCRSSSRARKFLLVWQVAISIVLMVGTGLFVRTWQNLRNVDTGFDPDNVLFASIAPGRAQIGEAQRPVLYRNILDHVRAIPGVQSASLSMSLLNGGFELRAAIEGNAPAEGEQREVCVNHVTGGYFQTLGMSIVMGSDFDDRAAATGGRVIINEAMRSRFFGGTHPIGRRIVLGSDEVVEIVGVVENARQSNLREPVAPAVYRQWSQMPQTDGAMTIAIRTQANAAAFADTLRRTVHDVAASIPVSGVGTLENQVSRSLFQEQLLASLAVFFGVLALFLACLGLYGLMSHAVTQRTSEIGIRLALGAQRSSVLWMILREGMLLVIVGIALGIPLAAAAARLITSQIAGLLFEVSTADIRSFATAPVVMATVAIFACWLPARRAAKIDPMVALRCE